MTQTSETSASHPLDPLNPDEIDTAKEVLEKTEDLAQPRYIHIELNEPTKEELKKYEESEVEIEREASIVIRDTKEKRTYEGVISLTENTLGSWKHVSGAQPILIGDEFVGVEETVKANEEFREAVRKRNGDPDLAWVTAWSAGHDFVPEDIDRDRRLAHGNVWVKREEDDHGYARPLTGIHPWVDVDEMEVIKVVDTGVKNSDVINNLEDARYRAENRELRKDLKPYNVEQPEGPSWEIDDYKVEWQKWHIRVGFTQHEGLVLHDIGYEDDGEVRSILNRASVAEVISSYNDPAPDHNWRNPWDIGEYTIGRLANSLTEGCDCLGHMHYWDAVINDGDGEPQVIPNAICLHEEDNGILWKHHDWRVGDDEVRRSRRLVISFISTIGNYDFGFYWYFYQNGKIESEVRLTGCNATGALPEGETETGYSEMVAPNVKSMFHQHAFNYRLDFDIDGRENSIYQVEAESVPYGPGGYKPEAYAEVDRHHLNPHGNAGYAKRTRLETESEAKQMADPLKSRYWQIVNENKTNSIDQPVGYRLKHKKGDPAEFLPLPDSQLKKRAGFANYHLWTTPHNEDENYPAGNYPNQNPGGEGLPDWASADRSLVDEDLVVWYNIINNHISAPEDWPVLPAVMYSFILEPVNFFDENPAIDVPPEHHIKDIESHSHDEAAGDD